MTQGELPVLLQIIEAPGGRDDRWLAPLALITMREERRQDS